MCEILLELWLRAYFEYGRLDDGDGTDVSDELSTGAGSGRGHRRPRGAWLSGAR